MDVKRIRELLLADPFKPFFLIMNDNRYLPVERAVFLTISPKGNSLLYVSPRGGFDLLMANDVEDAFIDEAMTIRPFAAKAQKMTNACINC